MNRALMIPIVAVILLILIAQRVNSNNNSFTGANTQMALANIGASIRSSDTIENPTRSECGSKVGHTGISLTFIAACILLYPHDFKEGEGGTLVINKPDSSEGIEPFGSKN
jgi:hypothetical protein